MLFYGTDAGLVSERAAALAKSLAARDDPPGEIIRVDDASLEDDPDRIFVELQTAPMFGGAKIVRAPGRRVTAARLKPLIEAGGLQGIRSSRPAACAPTMRCARCSRSPHTPLPSPASRTRPAISRV